MRAEGSTLLFPQKGVRRLASVDFSDVEDTEAGKTLDSWGSKVEWRVLFRTRLAYLYVQHEHRKHLLISPFETPSDEAGRSESGF